MNGIVFLVLLFIWSLPVYRNVINICVLILYPGILLNSFINSMLVVFYSWANRPQECPKHERNQV